MSSIEIGGVKYAAAWDSVKANGECEVAITLDGTATFTWK